MTPNMQLCINCSGDRGKHVFFFFFDAHGTDARVCRARFFCHCSHRFVTCIDTELPQSATNQLLSHFMQKKAKFMVNMQRQMDLQSCPIKPGLLMNTVTLAEYALTSSQFK
uniref:Uncharacterized protein n=1 Tax=Rhipicephalus zambeziensis TaxID=60191 RepID=A0A224YI89_9ACAR